MRPAIFTKIYSLTIISQIMAFSVDEQQLAFPTAEGYGKFAKGGRGGKVYEVTTLKGTGSGSLGEALAAKGPRTVVFRVSGTIEASYKLSNGQITIAGQTAPGDGICIKGNFTISNASDVIIRYIRIRAKASGDAISGRGKNLIFDHVSCSWSNDEVFSIYGGSDVTFQYCLISEACERGKDHRFGGIWGNNNSTYHHNCFAHNDSRTPRWNGGGSGNNDFRNNIIYNWGYGNCYGAGGKDMINMVANYYKPGPATLEKVIAELAEPYNGTWYFSDNVLEGNAEVTADNSKGITGTRGKILDTPTFDAMPIRQETPKAALETFLKHGGCSFPNWDAVDARIIEEIRTGTATFGKNGIIDHPNDVGGWPELKSLPAPPDSDHDGLPDSWEKENGLDPNDAGDGAKTGKDGYTNLENYMNGLVDNIQVSTKKRAENPNLTTSNFKITSSSSSSINITVTEKSNLHLEIFNLNGRRVALLRNNAFDAGNHSVDIGDLNVTSGSYLYKIKTAGKSAVGKMFIVN